ncbi:MAG: hypothetical protein PHP57_13490 [Sideroxydans sp.]|nr:hypothetical protein [Sideroxydans sp.]
MQKVEGRLPEEAQRLLREAAKTPNTPKDPMAKIKAIDAAVAKVKSQYPSYFKE